MTIDGFINLHSDEEYMLASILEKILQESYVLIGENIDLGNSYDYQKNGSSIWSFHDKHNVNHYTKVNYNPGVDRKQITVKFFWINEDRKLRYDRPPYTDEKVFNTHLNIFINQILPMMEAYEDHFGVDYITLDPTDKSRYRLYRMALGKVLNQLKYEMIEDKDKDLIYIKIRP